MRKFSYFFFALASMALPTQLYADEGRENGWDDTAASFVKMLSGEVDIKDDPDYAQQCSAWNNDLAHKSVELAEIQKKLSPVYAAYDGNQELIASIEHNLEGNYPKYKECEKKYNAGGRGFPLKDYVSDFCKHVARQTHEWSSDLSIVYDRQRALANENRASLEKEEALENQISHLKNNIKNNEC